MRNFGVTSLNNAFFIDPILPADRCNFDTTFRSYVLITAIRLDKLLITDRFTIEWNKIKCIGRTK